MPSPCVPGTLCLTAAPLPGPPTCRDHNFAMNIFWAWWWPLVFISYPFLGRVWCAVCPFMLWGTLAQRLRVR